SLGISMLLAVFFCDSCRNLLCLFFFFFQAEDGIRDRNVTGVQTCALPICGRSDAGKLRMCVVDLLPGEGHAAAEEFRGGCGVTRSEERRVGKECRCRGWPEQ